LLSTILKFLRQDIFLSHVHLQQNQQITNDHKQIKNTNNKFNSPCILEPGVKDIFELQFRDDVRAGESGAHILQVRHVVLVGKNEDWQGVLLVEHDVARVEELEKPRENVVTRLL
jgi:hypothetical protein